GSSGGNANLRIVNSTLSSNSFYSFGGESIYNYGDSGTANVKLGSAILNTAGVGASITSISGTVTSLGYNLSSDDGGGLLTAAGDQTNSDPLLGPLQDNGGPT